MGITDTVYAGYNKVDRDFLDKSKVDMQSWGHVKSVHNNDRTLSDLDTTKTLEKGA
ncbi:MAG: hypothetical protein ACJAWS_001382 [Oleiphilaceae bacterium]|jgi:hypothetical protein